MTTPEAPPLRLDAAFYDLTQEAGWGLTAVAMATYERDFGPQDPALPALLEFRRGLAEAPSWIVTQAVEFNPLPLTVERFLVRAVFSSPRIVSACLDLMTSEGWFDCDGDAYHLTPFGHSVYGAARDYAQSALAAFDAIDPAAFDRLAVLLRRVIDAALISSDVPTHWCLSHSRRRAPDDELPSVVHFVQYCDDLNALRDDAHLAAFGRYAVLPAAREPFALVASGTASNAEDLFAKLAYRGHSVVEFQDALQHLVGHGLIELRRDGFTATEAGLLVRADIEYLTDSIFYAPWSVLEAAEMEELYALLLTVRDTVRNT